MAEHHLGSPDHGMRQGRRHNSRVPPTPCPAGDAAPGRCRVPRFGGTETLSEDVRNAGVASSIDPERRYTIRQLYVELARYHQMLEETGHHPRSTIETYVVHPVRFLRWLSGEYDPRHSDPWP
jgi:hypothetical protein